jgi:hypothetical protein
MRQHLENLRALVDADLGEIRESNTNDYRYRMIIPRDVWAMIAAKLIADIDYGNFKSRVAAEERRGHVDAHYEKALHEIWSVMYNAGNPAPRGGAAWWRDPASIESLLPVAPRCTHVVLRDDTVWSKAVGKAEAEAAIPKFGGRDVKWSVIELTEEQRDIPPRLGDLWSVYTAPVEPRRRPVTRSRARKDR